MYRADPEGVCKTSPNFGLVFLPGPTVGAFRTFKASGCAQLRDAAAGNLSRFRVWSSGIPVVTLIIDSIFRLVSVH